MIKRLLVYFVLSLLLVLVLFPHVEASSEEPVSYLSYFIYLLGLVAMVIYYRHMIRIEREEECANKARLEAASFLGEIQHNQLGYPIESLNKLGYKQYDLSTNRIIDHIRTEALARRFDSSLTILNAYKDEFLSKVIRLAGFQKTALQIGILGTFIGLSMAFRRIDTNNVDFAALITSLKLPFATSIAGLEVAIILWLHLDYLHHKQEKLFVSLEKCIDEVLNLARRSVYQAFFSEELARIGGKVDDMAGRIEKESAQIENQTNQISQGLSLLGEAGKGFDDFLLRLSEKQREFMQTVEELYKSLSPGQITSELKAGLASTLTTMNETLEKLQKDMAEHLHSQEEHAMQQQKELFNRFDELLKTQREFTQQLKNIDIRDHIRQVIGASTREISAELQAQIQKLVHPMTALAETINTQNQLMLRKLNKRSFIHRIFSKN